MTLYFKDFKILLKREDFIVNDSQNKKINCDYLQIVSYHWFGFFLMIFSMF